MNMQGAMSKAKVNALTAELPLLYGLPISKPTVCKFDTTHHTRHSDSWFS